MTSDMSPNQSGHSSNLLAVMLLTVSVGLLFSAGFDLAAYYTTPSVVCP